MKPWTRRILRIALLSACLAGLAGQASPASFRRARSVAAAPEGEKEAKSESRELVYKVINFLLLVGGLAYLLRKPVPAFFAERSASIRKSLDEGRKALESSQAQLRAVEAKLARLEEEIRAFRDAASREMDAERERLRRATAEEAERTLEASRGQVEASMRAGILELKRYTSGEALRLAEGLILRRLDDASRRRLVNRFVEQLTVRS